MYSVLINKTQAAESFL